MWRGAFPIVVLLIVTSLAIPIGTINGSTDEVLTGDLPTSATSSGENVDPDGEHPHYDVTGSDDSDIAMMFGTDVEVDDDPLDLWKSFPAMALGPDGSNHAVWRDTREGNFDSDIYYAKSMDNGSSWSVNFPINDDISPPVNNTTRADQSTPSIAVDNLGRIHVVWRDCRKNCSVYYTRSDDGGNNFIQNSRVSDSFNAADWPEIAVDTQGNPHVAWFSFKGGPWRVYYSLSTDGGQTWTPGMIVTDVPGIGNGFISMDVDEMDTVHIVWQDSRNVNNPPGQHNTDIYYDSAPFGGPFGTDMKVGDEGTNLSQSHPDLAVRNGRIHIVWDDMRNADDPYFGEKDVYYSHSDDGQDFSTAVQVHDNTSGTKVSPSIGVDSSGKVHVVWTDGRNLNTSSYDIYYSASADGVTFSNNTRVNSNVGPDLQITPELAVSDSGTANVVWSEDRSGNKSIYYNRGLPDLNPLVMKGAVLGGRNLENVTISWEISWDDGPDSVDVFEVYRSTTYDPSGLDYQLVASIPNNTSEFIDAFVGEGDPYNYYYLVCAVDTNNTTVCAEDQAGKLTRALSKGPNLISIPLVQSNESIETVLQTVNYDKAWFYDSSSQQWKSYMKDKTYRGKLLRMKHTMGFWVNVTEEGNLTVAGIVPAQTMIRLHRGWNLVSFLSFNSTYTVGDLKADIGAVRVEGFDSSLHPCYLRVLGDMEVLSAGYGYWVSVEADTVWTLRLK